MSIFPSGEQVDIAHGDLRATIAEVGGTLRTLHAADLEVLDGFPAEEMDHDGRGQILIPWANRLAGATYTFEGNTYQLPINEPSHGNAIHGLVRWLAWKAEDHTTAGVRMTHRLFPMPGYPFALDLWASYALTDGGLYVSMGAINVGAEGCPFGAGHHPYLSAGTRLVDEASLRVPARTIHRYNDQLVPVERVPVEGTPLDFRSLRRIGDTVINMDYTELERDADRRARVVLQAPDGGPTVEVWMDEAFKHVTVYTGETVQPPYRRRNSVAIEPMTCPPNAFQTSQDLIVLQPGEAWQGNWGIVVTRP